MIIEISNTYLFDDRSCGIICDYGRLAYGYRQMLCNLIINTNNNLALVSSFIWSLYVFYLKSVSCTSRVISHAMKSNEGNIRS